MSAKHRGQELFDGEEDACKPVAVEQPTCAKGTEAQSQEHVVSDSFLLCGLVPIRTFPGGSKEDLRYKIERGDDQKPSDSGEEEEFSEPLDGHPKNVADDGQDCPGLLEGVRDGKD